MMMWQKWATDPLRQNKIALQTEKGLFFSWQALAEKIEERVHFWQSQGVSSGMSIALCGKNSAQLLFDYLALLQLNTAVLPLNPAFSPQQIDEICTQNQCAFLLSNQGVEKQTICTPFPKKALTLTLTSGSSGSPKAVVHSLAAHLQNAKGVCELVEFGQQSCWMLSLPLYHVSGQGIVWRWLLQGAMLSLAQDDFYATALQSTHISLVPTQLQRLLNYCTHLSQSQHCLKHILLGGAHIPTNLVEQAQSQGFHCYVGYGMTEMASTICAKPFNGKNGVGTPLLGRQCKIVQDEIWLQGAGLADGYWYDGKLHSITNADGWFITKDKGEWRDNELHILGRTDNMFISGGENIQPEQIEQLILLQSNVEQVMVLPKNDDEFGQRPVALIKFHHAFDQSAVKKVQDFLQSRLEKFKLPVAYYPLEHIHRSDGQIKLSRKQLLTEFIQYLGESRE